MKKKKSYWILALIILSIVIFLGCARSCNSIDLSKITNFFNKITNKTNFNVADTKPPVIILKGPQSITLEQGSKWKEPGYKAIDNVDGNVTNRVVVDGVVDTSVIARYKIVYTVKDRAGNEASPQIRYIDVVKRTH